MGRTALAPARPHAHCPAPAASAASARMGEEGRAGRSSVERNNTYRAALEGKAPRAGALAELTVVQLRDLCRAKGLSGFSKANRQGLVDLLLGRTPKAAPKADSGPAKGTVDYLRAVCRTHGVRGYSGLRKAELVALIRGSGKADAVACL